MNTYDKGDLVRISGAFATADGTAVDPDAVLCETLDPAGVTTAYTYGTDAELTRDSAGHYHLDIDAGQAGVWYYRFYSTGNGQAADEGTFIVAQSNF